MCPEAPGLDARLKLLQILRVQKTALPAPATGWVTIWAGVNVGERLGPDCAEFGMLGASLRVQVWLLKRGDANNSGLNTTEGGLSLTHQVNGGHSLCSERSWRGPGPGSVVPSSDVGSSHHPRLLATTSLFQLGGSPVPFTGTTSEVHTFPPHTPHWPGRAHMAAPPAARETGGAMYTSGKAGIP